MRGVALAENPCRTVSLLWVKFLDEHGSPGSSFQLPARLRHPSFSQGDVDGPFVSTVSSKWGEVLVPRSVLEFFRIEAQIGRSEGGKETTSRRMASAARLTNSFSLFLDIQPRAVRLFTLSPVALSELRQPCSHSFSPLQCSAARAGGTVIRSSVPEQALPNFFVDDVATKQRIGHGTEPRRSGGIGDAGSLMMFRRLATQTEQHNPA